MFFSKPKNILGIDIGTSHIKAVELRPDPIKPFLVSYGMVNVVLPPDATPGTDPIAQVADVLSALHQKAQFTTNRVILSLPSNVAFVSVFDFPKMGERELQVADEQTRIAVRKKHLMHYIWGMGVERVGIAVGDKKAMESIIELKKRFDFQTNSFT